MQKLQELTDSDMQEAVDALPAELIEEMKAHLEGTESAELPFPFPWLLRASGRYEYRPRFWTYSESGRAGASNGQMEEAADGQRALFPYWFRREDLRLDVDGRFPLMSASGTIYIGLSMRVHWIANLNKTGANSYTGHIWYKDGDTSWLPHSNVAIKVNKSWFSNQRRAKVTFSGGGAPKRTKTFRWKSYSFHPAEFEFDTVEKSGPAVTEINTSAHPTRPAGLPAENLSIVNVFQRCGFAATLTGGDNQIPIIGAGPDALWTDMEMHDAMQTYWTRFANKPQWSMWTLFARQHAPVPSQGITPDNLGGIMFDDIGPNHRQGTSVFTHSFIKNPPAGDPNPDAWVKRMIFWTACHEMGHAFNLAHSWQKALGSPWIPLSNVPEERSFMNYPFRVSGGQHAFFSDFEFRFSDDELLFMRHAPERFVQHGNADWFDDHGFRQANLAPVPTFQLELRVHRKLPYFEFMEPVTIEAKLTNVSGEPQIVDENVLLERHDMTVIIKKRERSARQWRPFAQYLYHAGKKALEPGESVYAPLLLSTGLNGWDISEPGVYTIQVALHLQSEDVVSNALEVRVAPPTERDEELVAQDFFSEDVGRVLAFRGSRSPYLQGANDTLKHIVDQFDDRRVASHARLALGNPLTRIHRLLMADGNGGPGALELEPEKEFEALEPAPEEARNYMSEVLLDKSEEAADTLGHIEYRSMASQYGSFLAEEGEPDQAASLLQAATETLADREVLQSVLDEMEEERRQYEKE